MQIAIQLDLNTYLNIRSQKKRQQHQKLNALYKHCFVIGLQSAGGELDPPDKRELRMFGRDSSPQAVLHPGGDVESEWVTKSSLWRETLKAAAIRSLAFAVAVTHQPAGGESG